MPDAEVKQQRAARPEVIERRAAVAVVREYLERVPALQKQTAQVLGLRASSVVPVAQRAAEQGVRLRSELKALEADLLATLAKAPKSIADHHVSTDLVRSIQTMLRLLSQGVAAQRGRSPGSTE